MEGMKRFSDKLFDLAVVDLEYGIGASKPSVKPCQVVQKNGNKLFVNSNKHKPKEWDFKMSLPCYFDELFRISKNQIIWGGFYYGLAGGGIVWDKLNGESDQFDCEIAFQSFNKRTDLVYYMWSGMFQGEYCGRDIRRALKQQGDKRLNEERIHPTQKPVKLYDWIYKNYLPQGGKVIDTHLGSGSNRIAADKSGNIDFYGWEIDKDYFDAHEKRWRDYKSQIRINF